MKVKSITVAYRDDGKINMSFSGEIAYKDTAIEVTIPNLETGMEGRLVELSNSLSVAADVILVEAMSGSISMDKLLEMMK